MNRWTGILSIAAFVGLTASLLMAFLYAPTAQCNAGCLTQKIFYFHVPSAYAMYIGVGACLVGSLGFLITRRRGWDALGQAGGELAVVFSLVVLTTGPLWGRKAWGTYWVWDPRLTTTLLASLIYVAYLALRTGGGEAERKFSAALATMGSAIIPIIHESVTLWQGQHPTVFRKGGGGVSSPMAATLSVSFLSFTLLAAAFILLRVQMARAEERIEALRTEAASLGLIGEES